jgi:hypothetical protein
MEIFFTVACVILIFFIYLFRRPLGIYRYFEKETNKEIYWAKIRSLVNFNDYPSVSHDHDHFPLLSHEVSFNPRFSKSKLVEVVAPLPDEDHLTQQLNYYRDKIDSGSDPARHRDFELVCRENIIHLNFIKARQPIVDKLLNQNIDWKNEKDWTKEELEEKLSQLDTIKQECDRQNLIYKSAINEHVKKVMKHREWQKSHLNSYYYAK